jgi:hypothetical protein
VAVPGWHTLACLALIVNSTSKKQNQGLDEEFDKSQVIGDTRTKHMFYDCDL